MEGSGEGELLFCSLDQCDGSGIIDMNPDPTFYVDSKPDLDLSFN